MNLTVEALTPESFDLFGRLIEPPDRQTDAQGNGWSWWGEVATLPAEERPYAFGLLDLQPVTLRIDWAERHMHSQEVIIPLGGDCLIYVAPAEFPDAPTHLPDFDQFHAFRVAVGQAVILHAGVWHGAPFAYGAPSQALVLLLKGTAPDDIHLVRFEDTPLTIIQ